MQTRASSARQVPKSIHSVTSSDCKATRSQSAPIDKECTSLRSQLQSLRMAYNALVEEKRKLAEENVLLAEALQVYYKNVLYMAIRKLYSRAQADQARCPFVPDQFIETSTSPKLPHFPSIPPPTDLPTSAMYPWSRLFDADDNIFDAFRILRHIGSHESNAWDLKQAILRLGSDVSTHLKDVARAGFTLVTGCTWEKADKQHRFSDGDRLYQRALAAKKSEQAGMMVQQQMAAMSQAKFTFACSKESGQVSYAPPLVTHVAEPSVAHSVSSEERTGNYSSTSPQSRIASPSSISEGLDAGHEPEKVPKAEGEVCDGEVIFVKMTQPQSAVSTAAEATVAATRTSTSTVSTSRKRKASPAQAQSKHPASPRPKTSPISQRGRSNPHLLQISVKRQRTILGSCAASPIDLTMPDHLVANPVTA